MSKHTERGRTIAIYPTMSGFAFAVFEGMGGLVDWGLVHRASSANGFRKRLVALLERYRPMHLVVEEVALSARGTRARSRILSAEALVDDFAMRLMPVLLDEVVRCFGRTKWKRAQFVVEVYPELHARFPRFRKAWMPEDPRMAIFDVVALGLAALWR